MNHLRRTTVRLTRNSPDSRLSSTWRASTQKKASSFCCELGPPSPANFRTIASLWQVAARRSTFRAAAGSWRTWDWRTAAAGWGAVEDDAKRWLFQHADLYVLPSYSENFGNTIAEALAHGTPVLTTSQTLGQTCLRKAAAGSPTRRRIPCARSCSRRCKPALRNADAWARVAVVWWNNGIRWRRSSARSTRVYAWLLGGPKPEEILYEN